MAMNAKVTAQVRILANAYGTPEYKKEEDRYFEILEDELRKQPLNGWIDMEDPTDCLEEAILDDDGAERTQELLDGYIRFKEIVARVNDKAFEDVADMGLIEKAKDYIAA